MDATNATNATRGNVYRAAMEGATYSLRNGYDALQGAGLSFDSIRLTGGGSQSAMWRQMVADVFALPVEVRSRPARRARTRRTGSPWPHAAPGPASTSR